MEQDDKKRWRQLLSRGRLYAIKAGHPEEADDFAQEYALKHLDGRINTTIRNHFVDYLRKVNGDSRGKHGKFAASLESNPLNLVNVGIFKDPLPAIDNPKMIEHLFQGIDPVVRACFFLSYYWGLSGEEIAQCFGQKRNWVHFRIWKARRFFLTKGFL